MKKYIFIILFLILLIIPNTSVYACITSTYNYIQIKNQKTQVIRDKEIISYTCGYSAPFYKIIYSKFPRVPIAFSYDEWTEVDTESAEYKNYLEKRKKNHSVKDYPYPDLIEIDYVKLSDFSTIGKAKVIINWTLGTLIILMPLLILSKMYFDLSQKKFIKSRKSYFLINFILIGIFLFTMWWFYLLEDSLIFFLYLPIFVIILFVDLLVTKIKRKNNINTS